MKGRSLAQPARFIILLPAILLAGCGPRPTGSSEPGVIPFSIAPTKVLASSPELLSLGKNTFEKECVACHGPTLEGTKLGPPLVGGQGTLNSPRPVRTVGSYWPFATTLWDYINRAMPHEQGGSLSADEVYALTAFVLYRNEIIQESDVLDAKSLPKIPMPNRNGFIPPRLEDIQDIRKRGCRLGTCP